MAQTYYKCFSGLMKGKRRVMMGGSMGAIGVDVQGSAVLLLLAWWKEDFGSLQSCTSCTFNLLVGGTKDARERRGGG